MDHAETLTRIAYQINTPEVTTMGACSNGCGRLARGAQTCADCLAGNNPQLKAAVKRLREQRVMYWERQERGR